jgi:hypothetical protein
MKTQFVGNDYAGLGSGDRNDCFVRAVALASGKSYSEVQELCKNLGRTQNKGTPWATVHDVLRTFPGTWEHFQKWAQPTLACFVEDNMEGSWVIFVRGHACALIDGVLHDWKPAPRRIVFQAFRFA